MSIAVTNSTHFVYIPAAMQDKITSGSKAHTAHFSKAGKKFKPRFR
jgi:hypothetical protein